MQRLRVDMFPKDDTDGKVYYVGKLQYPGTLKFEKGAAFLLYPEQGQAELHICGLQTPDLSNVFEHYKQRRSRINRARHGNLPVELHERYEDNPPEGMQPRKFFIGKIQFNGEIDCEKGVIFLAFTADQDEEELQIAVVNPEKMMPKTKPSAQSSQRYSFNLSEEE